jgi:hypothetical protein
MILKDNNLRNVGKEIYHRIYWKEKNLLRSSYHFLSMRNTMVADYLIERIHNEVNS